MYHVSIIFPLRGRFSYLHNQDIANYIYENSTALNLNLQGIWISDRKFEFPLSRNPPTNQTPL
jgi:hypothetical protein